MCLSYPPITTYEMTCKKIKSLISYISTYYALEVKRVTQPSLFVYFSNSKIKLVGRSYVVWSNKLQHTAWMTDRFIVPHPKLRLRLSSLHTQVHITPRLASPRIFSQPLFPFGDRFSVSSHNNSLRPEAIVYEVKTIQPSKKSVSFVLPLQPTNIFHQHYSFTCVKNPN